jgi:hypothetical protein
MDATLPAPPMLQAYFPQVEIGEPIEADPPVCVVVRQVLKAPVSAERLIKTKSDVNRKALRRYVLRRWIETGRQATLVICQMDYEKWLTGSKLPDNITVEHFNAIAGLDDYKDVRLLILTGRVIPSRLASPPLLQQIRPRPAVGLLVQQRRALAGSGHESIACVDAISSSLSAAP